MKRECPGTRSCGWLQIARGQASEFPDFPQEVWRQLGGRIGVEVNWSEGTVSGEIQVVTAVSGE